MSLRLWLPLNGDLHNQGLDGEATAVTVTNGSFVTNGKIGKCLKLGYTNNIIIPSLIGSKKMSWAYWCRIDEATATNWLDPIHWTSTKADGSDGFTSRQEFYTNCTNTGVWYKGGSLGRGSFGNIVIGEWNHFAFTIDYEAGEAIFYINGNQVSKGTTVDTTHQIAAIHNIRLGENGLSVSENDVRIYDEILSPKVIKEISKGLVLHYPLNRGGFGQDNLLPNTNFNGVSKKFTLTSGTEGGFTFTPTTAITASTSYTVSCRIRGNANMNLYRICTGGNEATSWMTREELSTTDYKYFYMTFTSPNSNKTLNSIYICTRYGSTYSQIGDWFEIEPNSLKLELGTKATPWMPNSADIDYAKLGLNDNIIYDVSGYQNNGEIYKYDSNGSIECVSDTPKYILSTHINSLNPNTSAASGTVFLYGHCSITNPNQLTMAFWCKPIQGYGGNTGQGQFATTNYVIGESTAVDHLNSAMNHRDSIIDINSADGNTHIRSSIGFTANEWHHYAITYNGQTAIVYKDGIESSRKSFDTPTLLGSFIGVSIGFSKAGGVWRRNNSYYSDFRIYATALSADDILTLYHTPISIANNGTLLTQGEISEV